MNQRIRLNNSIIWQYFDKKEQGTYLARCKICDRDLSFFSTSHNLRSHLVRRHQIDPDDVDIDSIEEVINNQKLSLSLNENLSNDTIYNRGEFVRVHRRSPSWVWQVFKKKSNYLVHCTLCGDDFKFSTTTTNLAKHIKRTHPLAYGQLRQVDQEEEETDEKEMITLIYQDDEDSNTALQQQDLYFEVYDGQINCRICKKNISDDGEDAKTHLEEHHPGLLARIIQNEEKKEEEIAPPQDSNDPEKNIFTEVVYLDPVPETSYKRTQYIEKPSNPKKRRLSPSPSDQDDCNIKVKKSPTELDSFLSYVTVLLKKLPSDVCSRVQLEIINLIMRAQFQLGPTSTSSSVQGPVTPSVTANATVTNLSLGLEASTEHDSLN